jgi:replicative DNA helicase
MNTATRPDAESQQQNVPPSDRQAEIKLLGALLIDNSYINCIADKVTSKDFYDPKNAIVFDAIVALHSEPAPSDLVTVTDKLITLGQLDKIGGRAYLIELTDDVYSAANCEHYAQIVHEKSLYRQIMKLGQEVYDKAKRQDGEPDELLQRIDVATLKIANQQTSDDSGTMLEMGSRFITNLDEIMDSREHPEIKDKWIRFGLTDLDRLLFRLEPGKTAIIAAPPGVGKTTLSLQLANRASKYGIATAYFLCEDPAQAFQTIVSWHTGIPGNSIRTGDLTDHQYKQIMESVPIVQQGLIHFEDISSNPTAHEIKRRLTRLLKQYDNIGLIVVDYIQLMHAIGRHHDNRNSELTEVSRHLSLLSAEMHLPEVICSQLSREQAKEKRPPELRDLRDSGSLEQDARLVVMLWTPWLVFTEDKFRSQYPENEAHAYVRKQNAGPTGAVKVVWNPNMVRFENIAQPWRGQA